MISTHMRWTNHQTFQRRSVLGIKHQRKVNFLLEIHNKCIQLSETVKLWIASEKP